MKRPSRLPRVIGAVVVIIVLAVAGLFAYGLATSQAGKVVFSTDAPVAGVTTGCSVDHQVSSVSATTSVYVTYIFSSTLGTDVISLSITKNGQTYLPATPVPTSDTNGYDCFSDTTDLSTLPDWGPGTYHFVATSSTGSIVAQGDLTVN